jgi:hypothetical protein
MAVPKVCAVICRNASSGCTVRDVMRKKSRNESKTRD